MKIKDIITLEIKNIYFFFSFFQYKIGPWTYFLWLQKDKTGRENSKNAKREVREKW